MTSPSAQPAILTGTGVWSSDLRYGDPAAIADASAELESLGYTALWIPDVGGELFDALDHLLASTSTITVASGILNVWMQQATDTAAWWNGLDVAAQQRVLLGLGISHGPLIGENWVKPLAKMRGYLDELDAGGVPTSATCLAALGPKMLELAGTRSGGAHPYLITPEHTAIARSALGDGPLLAPEQGVVFETDPDKARAIARPVVAGYGGLPNYANNWLRLGFTEDDLATVSDRLIDGLVAWGDEAAIAARVDEHRQAGADHVCIQVLTEPDVPLPMATFRALAPALT